MQYGICPLSIIPLRIMPHDESELTSQLLYGEHFKILEERSEWSRIRVAFDGFEAWAKNKQLKKISKSLYTEIDNTPQKLSGDLIEFLVSKQQELILIPLGASLNSIDYLEHNFDGNSVEGTFHKSNIIETALFYHNVPHLAGGKSPLGIDASGFTQMVYKLNGYYLKRSATTQAKQGEALSFIEESEPGDLAFFDDEDGIINHVGIIMENNYIIHVDEKVRIDRIDHSGIFNSELKKHTYKLRVIKKII